MMHVCHLSGSNVHTHYFRTMKEGLDEAGARVSFITLNDSEKPGWLSDDTPFRDLHAERRAYGRAAFQLARFLRDADVDILQTHLFDAAAVGVAAARLARRSLIAVTRHHLDEHLVAGKRLHAALDGFLARAADHVVVPSRAVKQHLVDYERVPAEQVDVINIGFRFDDLEEIIERGNAVRARLGLADSLVVGSVGRITEAKGIRFLLEAVATLASRGVSVTTLLVGEEPDGWAREVADSLGLSTRVIFTGFQREAVAFMAAMDVFVQPSLSESFSQVVVEAMASGTPVVASAVGGPAEIIDSPTTGRLVPPGDSAALADAMEAALSSSAWRTRVGREGARTARARFSASRMINESVTAYTRWLDQRGRRSGGNS